MASRRGSSPHNHSSPCAQRVAHRCALSCAYGPPTGRLSIPAERDGLDRQHSVRRGWYHATAPVRPHHVISQSRTTDDGSSIDLRGAKTFPLSPDDAHMAMLHQGVSVRPTPCLDAIPYQAHWLACGASLNTGLK